MVTVSLAPSASWLHEQVTFETPTAQVPPPDAAMLMPADGPVNRLEFATSAMFLLSLGPLFVTVSSNVAVPLPAEPDVDTVCASARSLDVRTVPQLFDALSLLTGSVVALATLAVLHN